MCIWKNSQVRVFGLLVLFGNFHETLVICCSKLSHLLSACSSSSTLYLEYKSSKKEITVLMKINTHSAFYIQGQRADMIGAVGLIQRDLKVTKSDTDLG